MRDTPLIIAFDVDNSASCLELAKKLDPNLCRAKIGKELFTACGPAIVEQLQHLGFDVFLDLKFHDIPMTVAKAVKAAADLGVWMVNVHASGGQRMLDAAVEAKAQAGTKTLLIGVTVLTSMSDDDLIGVGWYEGAKIQVQKLAALSYASGLDGVVCSAQETQLLRSKVTQDEAFVLVTPGIRPVGSVQDDQRRIVTPIEALEGGSSYLVIGRPVTQTDDPAKACAQIYTSLNLNNQVV